MPTTTWTTLAAPASQTSASTATSPIGTPFVQDTFSDVSGTALTAHVGELGATWTKHPTTSGADVRIATPGSTYPSLNLVTSWYVASGVPPSADYAVVGTMIQRTRVPLTATDLIARSSTTNIDTRYGARYATADNKWEMYRVLAGAAVVIGTSVVESITTNQTYTMRFVLQGSALAFYVDGVLKVSSTDTRLTAAGAVGIAQVSIGANSALSGLQFESFTAETLESVVTIATAVSLWSTQGPSSTTWAKASGASTAWTAL